MALIKPTVGHDRDTWAATLNDALDYLDEQGQAALPAEDLDQATAPLVPDVDTETGAAIAELLLASGPVQEADGTPIPGYRFRVIADPSTPTEIEDIIIEAI